MGWLEALVLGIVQGLTEFLPISSIAHQSIVGQFFGGEDPGSAFTAITQLGTETAVIIYFRKEIWLIITRWAGSLAGKVPRDDFDARMGWFIILGSLPIVILGILLKDVIEEDFRSLWIIGTTLIVGGIVLGIADHVGSTRKQIKQITLGDAVLMGLAQAMALVPGVSRSGATLSMGRFLGYDREAATRYAFLLAIPAVFGSGFYQLAKSWNEPGVFTLGETAVATVVAFFVALGVIAFFMSWISKHSFLPFVIYRVALGTLLLVLLSAGILQAY